MLRQTLLALTCASAIGTALALPPQEREIVYYSDASYTVEIGYIYVTCYGIYRYGSTSSFRQVYEGDRCYSPSTNGFGTSPSWPGNGLSTSPSTTNGIGTSPIVTNGIGTSPSAPSSAVDKAVNDYNELFALCTNLTADSDKDGVVSSTESRTCLGGRK